MKNKREHNWERVSNNLTPCKLPLFVVFEVETSLFLFKLLLHDFFNCFSCKLLNFSFLSSIFWSLWCEISGFCLLSFPQNERTYLCSVCILIEESVFVFQLLKKLKNKDPFLKKYSNWARPSSLVLTEEEETKNRYFAPKTVHNHFKLAFPTGQDSETFRDNGTEIPSLSRDKGTTGQAKNLAKGRNGSGQPKSGTGLAGTAKNRDGTRDKTGQSRKGCSKTEKGCSKTEKDVLNQERMF